MSPGLKIMQYFVCFFPLESTSKEMVLKHFSYIFSYKEFQPMRFSTRFMSIKDHEELM